MADMLCEKWEQINVMWKAMKTLNIPDYFTLW